MSFCLGGPRLKSRPQPLSGRPFQARDPDPQPGRSITKGEGGSQPQAQTFGLLAFFERLTRPPRLQQGLPDRRPPTRPSRCSLQQPPIPTEGGSRPNPKPLTFWPSQKPSNDGHLSPTLQKTKITKDAASAWRKPKPLISRPSKQVFQIPAQHAASPRAKAAASPKPKPLTFGSPSSSRLIDISLAMPKGCDLQGS